MIYGHGTVSLLLLGLIVTKVPTANSETGVIIAGMVERICTTIGSLFFCVIKILSPCGVLSEADAVARFCIAQAIIFEPRDLLQVK